MATTFKYVHTTSKYTSKDELIDLVQMAKHELGEAGVDPEVLKSAFEEIDHALKISAEVRDKKGKLLRVEEVKEEIELELDMNDIFNEAFESDPIDATDIAMSFLDESDILDKAYEIKPPVKSSDILRDYDFKRWLCDVFETGYHVEDFTLIKAVAVRLDKAWEVM
jgi:hypothetical protein